MIFPGQPSEHVCYRAQRKRHGIPDDDHRPFQIAYSDAVQRRRKQVANVVPPYISARTLEADRARADQASGARRRTPFGPEQPQPATRPEPLSFGVAHHSSLYPLQQSARSRTPSLSLQAYPFSFQWVKFFLAALRLFAHDRFCRQRPPSRLEAERPIPEHANSAPEHATLLHRPQQDRAPHTTGGSTLNRQSRKRLQLGPDEERYTQQDAITKKSRGNKWGQNAEIDGDDQPRWARPVRNAFLLFFYFFILHMFDLSHMFVCVCLHSTAPGQAPRRDLKNALPTPQMMMIWSGPVQNRVASVFDHRRHKMVPCGMRDAHIRHRSPPSKR